MGGLLSPSHARRAGSGRGRRQRARKRLQYRRMHGTAPPVVRRTNLTHIAESAIRGEQKRKRVRRRGSAGAEAAIPRVFGEAAARKASPLAGIGAAIAACGAAGAASSPCNVGPVAQWLEPAAHNGLVAGRVLPGPPRTPIRTGVSQSLANNPQFAGISARPKAGRPVSAAG